MKPIFAGSNSKLKPAWSSRAIPGYKLPPDTLALGLHAEQPITNGAPRKILTTIA
jgi:hypothetical protein